MDEWENPKIWTFKEVEPVNISIQLILSWGNDTLIVGIVADW